MTTVLDDEDKTVFTFAELSPRAKERARDWWRECESQDNTFAECVIEDAERVADLLGVELQQTAHKTVGGRTRYEPAIYWALHTQGAGACFEGTWRTKEGCYLAVKEYAPTDKELHDIALRLALAEWPGPYNLSVKAVHRGREYHEQSMDFEVYHDETDEELDEAGERAAEAVKEALRDFATWIHRQIEDAYDWTMSDEHVDENIEANEYEFDEDGRIL